MKLLYLYSNYFSFKNSAQSYARILKDITNYTEEPSEDIDVALLHGNIEILDLYLHQLPFLHKKYKIAYFVWESNFLPFKFIPILKQFDEIWTCSHYCKKCLEDSLDVKVHLIPHIVENIKKVSQEEACAVLDNRLPHVVKIIKESPQVFNFFSIINDYADLRKNAEFLNKVFSRCYQDIRNIRLIIKTTKKYVWDAAYRKNIMVIQEQMDFPEILALYSLSDAYVSLHLAEGWGLTISDAMQLKIPVVCSGYSGNTMFTTKENAYWVESNEDLIPAYVHKNLDQNLYWFAIDFYSAYKMMMKCFKEKGTIEQQKKIDLAYDSVQKYHASHIEKIIEERINDIENNFKKKTKTER